MKSKNILVTFYLVSLSLLSLSLSLSVMKGMGSYIIFLNSFILHVRVHIPYNMTRIFSLQLFLLLSIRRKKYFILQKKKKKKARIFGGDLLDPKKYPNKSKCSSTNSTRHPSTNGFCSLLQRRKERESSSSSARTPHTISNARGSYTTSTQEEEEEIGFSYYFFYNNIMHYMQTRAASKVGHHYGCVWL